jgi:hypothetical protein
MPTRILLAAAATLAAAVLASTAAADGDPASDILLTQDVYVPYPAPSTSVTDPLMKTVAAAFAKGYRVKVAVIATKTDLGSVPELYDKPKEYAKFLGTEIEQLYAGPLLIVMPAGYGVYDAGRSTVAEERVLESLGVEEKSADGLVAAADAAVRKLTETGALKSKDIRPPAVFPRTAVVEPGRTVKLTYSVLEDSERSKEIVKVYAGKKRLAVMRTKLKLALYTKPRVVRFTAPKPLPHGAFRYCVAATDAAGNRSRTACMPLAVKRG